MRKTTTLKTTMRKTTRLLCAVLLMATAYAEDIQLSPNRNGKQGVLPTGYSNLVFELRNGNWTDLISLPQHANANDKISIVNQAQFSTSINTLNINIPIKSLKVTTGQRFSFVFNAQLSVWELQSVNILRPQHKAIQSRFDFDQTLFQQIQISNHAWSNRILLPDTAADGTWVKISSDAHLATSLDSANLLFDSSYILKKGDQYWLRYYAELKKWVIESIQARQRHVNEIGERLKQVDAAVTQINVSDGHWVPSFSLPAMAKDRDRVIVYSTADWPTKIENREINSSATLSLKKGDRYEFVYIKDLGKWHILSAPKLKLQAQQIKQQQLPNTEYPSSYVEVNPSDWQAQFILPASAQVNDKVIFKSTASKDSHIRSLNGLEQVLHSGETQRYIYTEKGWAVDSYSLDVLFVVSPDVVQRLGESAAKMRLIAAQALTNLTAENSNAQFYLRQAGQIIYKIPGDSLSEVLYEAVSDEIVQGKRDQFEADTVYYEGIESDYCGLAFEADDPISAHMIASGSIDCGLNVMRHEIGHNLGVRHAAELEVTYRGFDHVLGSTVMGENSLDFYSSPHLFSPRYGVRLGEFGKMDAVALINKNAPKIASFGSRI